MCLLFYQMFAKLYLSLIELFIIMLMLHIIRASPIDALHGVALICSIFVAASLILHQHLSCYKYSSFYCWCFTLHMMHYLLELSFQHTSVGTLLGLVETLNPSSSSLTDIGLNDAYHCLSFDSFNIIWSIIPAVNWLQHISTQHYTSN